MTQLLSMWHTSILFQMHHNISKESHLKPMSVQTCSLAMIGLLQVEYSSWWYALVSLSVYYPKVCSQCSPHLSLA